MEGSKMTGFVLFVILVAFLFVGGYLKAKKDADSTPIQRSLNRAAPLWNEADPAHRAMMLASIGILEHSPSFSVCLTSTWAQLDSDRRVLLAAAIDGIMTYPKGRNSLPEAEATSSKWNPALDELRQLPQTAITAGLIAAVPALAAELYAFAPKLADAAGISDPVFIDCLFDLQLVGAFEKAMIFTGDGNLASLFVDAMVFEATGESPSVPTDADMTAGQTHKHRGIHKYVLASKQFSGCDPFALLFGREYANAKVNGLNQADVDRGSISAIYGRQSGAWAADLALTGKGPTDEEVDALSKRIDGKKPEPPRIEKMFPPKQQMPQEKGEVELPTQIRLSPEER
jgi:hypothetical protein